MRRGHVGKIRTHNKGGRFGGSRHSSNARPPRPVAVTRRYGR
jgi:hypothetical protein